MKAFRQNNMPTIPFYPISLSLVFLSSISSMILEKHFSEIQSVLCNSQTLKTCTLLRNTNFFIGLQICTLLTSTKLPFFPIKVRWGKVSKLTFSQFSSSVVSNSLLPRGLQHSRPPCPSPTPRVYSNSCPWSWWCHPTISSSAIPFSSHLQSFPASRSFKMSQFFPSGGQSIGVSASTSVLPKNTQDWSPLGWSDWISLQSKGLSRVFSNTTVQKHQFFCLQLSL